MLNAIKKYINGSVSRRDRNFRILPLAFSLLFVVGVVTLLVAAAGPVSLYLAPASQSVSRGSSFSVAVRANTQGNSIDYVKAYINYPADKLSVTGISAAGSNFDYQLEAEVSGSQVRIARYSTTGVKSGDLLVATITFTAANTGTAVVNYDAASIAIYTGGGSNQPATATSGGSYSITTPVSPPVPNPQPATPPPSSTAPSPSAPPASPPATQPNTPPESPPNVPLPVPVTATPSEETLYPVVLKVSDHKGQSAAGVEVRAGEASLLTDDAGLASILIAQGEHSIFVKSKNVSKQFTIHVKATSSDDGTSPAVQEINLVLPDSGLSLAKIIKYFIAIILGAILLLAVYLTVRKIRKRSHTKTTKPKKSLRSPGTPVVTAPAKPASQDHVAADSSQHGQEAVAATVHKHQPEPEINLPASSTAKTELHPHDKAKTIQPLSVDEKAPDASGSSSAAGTKDPESMQPKTQVAQPKSTTPKPAPAAQPKSPEPPKPAPPLVEPYKPDGEPKDIFEMAEERFNNDDRLKGLRK